MYSSFQLARKYLRYYASAHNGKGHGMHSPFVFQFILNVLHNGRGYEMPGTIETLRAEMLACTDVLTIQDLGAGSRTGSSRQRTVSKLAKAALKPKKYGQLLYRLARYYQPRTIIELGTSLGTTTSYLAMAAPEADVVTIEGSEDVRAVAAKNFKKLGLANIRSLAGNFDTVLPSVLAEMKSVDLAYIDGNHRYAPTKQYFQQLLAKSHNDTILVFDDIHWSAEMEAAWAEISQHPDVRCTVDTFFLGFVFFRSAFKERRHFSIRF
ncbi:MAG: class SAM-dependent methyltransferase [Flaviaesturariibacter sp.]|nr:class SAM-dependent methyltransferase [Flaviaesturariibacter sp.]